MLATVKGDVHDIGKNIVKVVLESYGYEVIDLGKDTPSEKVVQAYVEHLPLAVGLSALMTNTVKGMEETVHALKNPVAVARFLSAVRCLTKLSPNKSVQIITQRMRSALSKRLKKYP